MKNLLFTMLFFSIFSSSSFSQEIDQCVNLKNGVNFYVAEPYYTIIKQDNKVVYQDAKHDDRTMDYKGKIYCHDIYNGNPKEGDFVVVRTGNNGDQIVAFAISYNEAGFVNRIDRLYWAVNDSEDTYIKIAAENGNQANLIYGRKNDVSQRIGYDFSRKVWRAGGQDRSGKLIHHPLSIDMSIITEQIIEMTTVFDNP